MTMIARRLLPLFAILLAAAPARAQQRRGPHGGLLAGSQGHEVELLVEGTSVRLYAIDHGRVAPPRAGTQARMVIQEGQATRTVQLTASGDAFTATLEAPMASGARVVITGRMPDGHTVQARYVMP
jgi:hypothetical protein